MPNRSSPADSRLQHLELDGLPASWNPFAGMSKEEKAAFDELEASMDTLNTTIANGTYSTLQS